jgi:ribose transport system substrate-binding protein
MVTAFVMVGCVCMTGTASAATNGQVRAQALVNKNTQALRWVPQGPSFHAKKDLSGKSVYYIGIGLNYPFVIQVEDGLKAAASLFGVNVVGDDAQASTVTASRQMEQAVSNGAAAIVVEGLEAGAMHAAISDAAAHHVPVIFGGEADTGYRSGDEPVGVFGNASASYYNAGQMMAQIAVAKLGTVHAAFIVSSDQINSPVEYDGFKSELTSLCSKCTVTSTDVPESNWASGLGPAATTAISNPSINLLAVLYDAELEYTLPSIEAANAENRVKVVTYNATLPGMQELVKGNPVIGDPGASNTWDGWAMFDQVLRALNGQPAARGELPNRAFTPQTAATLNLTTPASLGSSWFTSANLKTEYSKLWGLSSSS